MGDAGSRGVPGSGSGARRVWLRVEGTRAILTEVVVLWLVTLLLIKLVVFAQKSAGAPEIVLAAVPILFMYMPVLACWLRGVDSYDYPLALPAFSDRDAWIGPLKLNLAIVAVIFVPWVLGYHVYQTSIVPEACHALGLRCAPVHFQGVWPSAHDLPDGAPAWLGYVAWPLKLIGYHVFFVAIPEEMFYRGYLQSRLSEAFGAPWRVFGADLGPGWLLTCAIFAAGHSIVQFQWWHFAIFFPSLVFGWMRARTGGIVGGAMFHAWSNVTVSTLDTLYGIVQP